MGVAGIGAVQLLIVLVIAILVFGSKRIRTLGADLGKAIKSFKEETKTSHEPLEGQKKEAE